MLMKIYELDIHWKLIKQVIQWNQNLTNGTYYQREILVWKSEKICDEIRRIDKIFDF